MRLQGQAELSKAGRYNPRIGVWRSPVNTAQIDPGRNPLK